MKRSRRCSRRSRGCKALDERIAKTCANKAWLLVVLSHPEIPLHNNPAAMGARARVRKRDVSYGPRTREGAKAWDTFKKLAESATRLGVSFYHYIHDRVSGALQMPSLAARIAERAKVLNLGTSWDNSPPCARDDRRGKSSAHTSYPGFPLLVSLLEDGCATIATAVASLPP